MASVMPFPLVQKRQAGKMILLYLRWVFDKVIADRSDADMEAIDTPIAEDIKPQKHHHPLPLDGREPGWPCEGTGAEL